MFNKKALFGDKYSNSIQDTRPESEPFPTHQFSSPARYHNPEQTFAIGDLVWYELRGSFDLTSKGIQWGEAIIKDILPDNRYTLAGKVWNYDHFTHPLIGLPGGSPRYQSIQDIHTGRDIYKRWTISNHPNSHVRRMAMNGVDEVMHPALRSVPGDAMFKVWDREHKPECPVPSLQSGARSSGDDGKSEYSLEDAREKYGHDLGFQGMQQNNLGPEFWGITLEQLEAVLELPGYDPNMKMYDVVNTLIKPITDGTGTGYALFLNKEKPLRAKQMTSHAWGERYADFVRALKDSYCEGPFWVCAMSIYQEDNATIAQQLGPSLEHGPFATVLKQATEMVAVFTPAADIYLRMWCVFEIFVAVKLGVNIKFAALNQQLRSGIENIYDSIYEHGKDRCHSTNAKCGEENDEREIRKLINSTDEKFALLDSTVEWCKAMYYIGAVRPPGSAFSSEPAHLLLMGGSGKLDYMAKTLSSVALAIDRMIGDPNLSDDDEVKVIKLDDVDPNLSDNDEVKVVKLDDVDPNLSDDDEVKVIKLDDVDLNLSDDDEVKVVKLDDVDPNLSDNDEVKVIKLDDVDPNLSDNDEVKVVKLDDVDLNLSDNDEVKVIKLDDVDPNLSEDDDEVKVVKLDDVDLNLSDDDEVKVIKLDDVDPNLSDDDEIKVVKLDDVKIVEVDETMNNRNHHNQGVKEKTPQEARVGYAGICCTCSVQ
jgi:hypothetical protein